MASEANNTTPIDPKFKKGFEHGYWLKRGNSKDLDAIMERAKKDSPQYHSGLKAGQMEAQREAFRDRMKEADKERGKDKDKGMEMG